VDIIAYASVNGLDENGNEVKSSLFTKNTRKYHAGSRFDYLPGYIKEFTAENLQEAIAEAVKLQEKVEGIKSVDFKTQSNQYINQELTFEELQEKIKEIAMKLNDADRTDEYKEIIENILGVGKKVSEATKKQQQQLELILTDLEALEV
jgi:hypothetical protein